MYYKRNSSSFVGKCINAYDSFYINNNISLYNGDIKHITTCIEITNPDTVYETILISLSKVFYANTNLY